MSLPLLAILIAASLTTMLLLPAAYGQEAVFLNRPDENTDRLLADVMNKLQNETQDHDSLSSIMLTDGGDMIIMLNNGTIADYTDDTTIHTKHCYTPDQGYEFRGQEIIKPNGTELFP